MSTSIFCIASTENMANTIVSRLKREGFADDNISVLFPDKSTTNDFAHEKNTKAPEGSITGASAGGVAGGTIGLLAGIGLLAIPGLGPFVAAGPIMASLAGIAAGATVGGIAGALIGMGIPEIEAKRYEGKVKDGNILISVHAMDSDRVQEVKDIFESEDATDISTGSLGSVDGSDDDDSHAYDAHNATHEHERTSPVRTTGMNAGLSEQADTNRHGTGERAPTQSSRTPRI